MHSTREVLSDQRPSPLPNQLADSTIRHTSLQLLHINNRRTLTLIKTKDTATMQIETPLYTAIAILSVVLYILFAWPWSVSPDTTTTSASDLTSTPKVTVITIWDDDMKKFNLDATSIAKPYALDFVEITVKRARHRPRIVEVCAEGICEKKWGVSA